MRGVAAWSLMCVTMLAASTAAAARLDLGLGVTGISSDPPQRASASAALSVLWPFGFVELGPTFFVDDLGSTVGRLHDPNNGVDLGAVGTGHRMAFGGAWRCDFPSHRDDEWVVHADVTWGYYRVQDDRIGVLEDALSTAGWSFGAGFGRKVRPTTALGISGHYHRLLDQREDTYVRASVDLTWLPGVATDSRQPRKASPRNGN